MYNYLPHTDKIRLEMLREIGLNSIEDLFVNINPKIRMQSINIPEGISEPEATKKLTKLAQRNSNCQNTISFLGGGTYNRYIPACINTIVERSEFLTSYTPYQAEVSQGTLQVMYEYQSLICNLTGMDVANASVYDGANACAEAILMASRVTNKTKVLISPTLNPDYKAVIETYCYGENITVEYIKCDEYKLDIISIADIQDKSYACILIQNPNYLGYIEDAVEISKISKFLEAKLVVCVDPVSLAVLKDPSSYNADIVVGDIQSLGIPMSFGGPHGGFIACKSEYLRQLPGRIAGMTVDRDEERAFTLTLQAREQHIRRAKATSNICTNQALMALNASVYLAVMGPEGLKEVASTSAQRAHYLADKINQISGFKVLFNEFLYEFVIKVDDSLNVDTLLLELKDKNIFAGIKLDKKFDSLQNCILVCVTEMNEISDIEIFINNLQDISKKYSLQEK